MPFCSNCGAEIIEGAKFCQECGAPISAQAEQYLGKRQQEYSGKIYKCPNCGEILNAFEIECPVCGYELRGAKASSSVKELSEQISRLEQERTQAEFEQKKVTRHSPKNIIGLLSAKQKSSEENSTLSATDKSIASLIQNFPIPNTKEDIIEFLLLAATNIDTSVLDESWDGSSPNWKAKNTISKAWISKFEHAYQKAKMSFGSDSDFSEIEKLYKSKQKKIRLGKTKSLRYCLIFFGSAILLALLVSIFC